MIPAFAAWRSGSWPTRHTVQPAAAIFSTSRKSASLIEMMKEHDLAEIDLQQGEQRVKISRGGEPIVTGGAPAAYAPACRPRTPPAAVKARRSRRRRHASGRHQKPDGRHVLHRLQSRVRRLCQSWRPRGTGNHRLHHRGHESIQRNSRGNLRPALPPSWWKTAPPSNSASRYSKSTRGNKQ